MPEKEKAPAGAGTPTRAAGDGLPTMYPTKNFTTSTGKVLHISDLLHPGAENGVKLTELAALTNLDEREVRRRIQAERKAGKLILSDCLHGYFLPENSSDVQRFARSMSRRAAEIASIARAAEVALADMAGQQHMEGW
jgi:hypothetical protein